jgi:hypothetical protein
MKKIFAVAFVFALPLISCSTEKLNLSPVSYNLKNNLYSRDDISTKTEIIAYQSEISNLISTFPKFKNDALDKEVSNLKISLTDYIEAISVKNVNVRGKAYKNYVTSYIKIQELRTSLNKDMDEVLNRYMVRIKTNVNLLESIN